MGFEDQRIEIESTDLAEFFVVPVIHLRDVARGIGGQAIECHETVLRLIGTDQARFKAIYPWQVLCVGLMRIPATDTMERIRQHRFPVLGTRVDSEVRLDTEVDTVLTEHPSAEFVECTDLSAAFETGNEVSDPLRHFARCLVGKRQREDAEVLVPRGVEEASDTAGEHLGLPGTGTGQYEQRTVVPVHRLALHVGQVFAS